MKEHLEPKEQLSTLKRTLLTLERMQARLDRIEQEKREPIAIIGIGCRFPGGANSPEAFWELLCNEEDVISEIPADRWNINAFYDPDPRAPGKMHTRYGAFLRDIDKFDPGFFGISPREAMGMDPQQRLLLEVAWEALENAGQVGEQLHKSQTGVFIGIMSKDYAKFYERSQNLELIDAYYCTGNDFSFAPGRLSYVFGLHGPSIAIDTACSSSLVAVHLACQSLRVGECDMALAGGVSLILSPELNIFLSKAGAMSPDGRCKTFDASANGMGRGEGCGVVVLKRLSRALADGDPIHAIIRGSAINHDGPSGGLTVPNGLAQQALLRQALENAQVSPAQVGYVEAHGTGTILGDPIEIQAIDTVLGEGRPKNRPLVVGSVKTNLGHLDPAAGVAGLIKTVLQLQHGEIARHLNFSDPNPHIAWDDLNIAIPTQRREWSSDEDARIAGVSAFGLSGVNAHVIVQEAPQRMAPLAAQRSSAGRPYLLPLSAHNQDTLRALVQRYQQLLEETSLTEDALTDICYSASAKRTHHDYRLAVVAHSREELAAQLAASLEEGTRDSLSPDYVPTDQRRKLAFVFAGQGSQWYGMGRQLLASEPIFKETIEQCSQLLSRYTDWSLLAELTADETTSRLDQTEVAQPALFAIEVALARLWLSWGITLDAVIGHSVGEIAAAHIAGILTLEDAIRIVYHRGRLMQNATGQGKMAVVRLPQQPVEQALEGYTDHVAIAAINSPTATVISGTSHVVEMLVQNFRDQGVTCQFLRVNYAFHCPQMEPYRQEFVQHLQGIELHQASIPIISTVTGERCAWQEFDEEHWGHGMRDAVLFAPAIETLLDEGYSTILEIGPHPVLAMDIAECLQQAGISGMGKTLPSLRRNQNELLTLFNSLGTLYSLGYAINWRQLYPSGGHYISLPSYPWQRERLWITDRDSAPRSTTAISLPSRDGEHALLGELLELSAHNDVYYWESHVSSTTLPYTHTYLTTDPITIPYSVYLDMTFAAATYVLEMHAFCLKNVNFLHPLKINSDDVRKIQVAVVPDLQDGGFTVQISSRLLAGVQSSQVSPPSQLWVTHASASLTVEHLRPILADVATLPVDDSGQTEEAVVEHLCHICSDSALWNGWGVGSITQIWRSESEMLAKVALPEIQRLPDGIHSALLNACFHVLELLAGTGEAPGAIKQFHAPIQISALNYYQNPGHTVWCYAKRSPQTDAQNVGIVGDLVLFDEHRHVVVEVQGLHLQLAESEPEQVTSPASTNSQDVSVNLSRRQLLHASMQEQKRLLEEYLQHYVARTLRLVKGKLNRDLSLHKMGLDSLMALELKNHIEQDLEVAISLSALLEGPSITQLSQQILAQLQPATEAIAEAGRLEQTGRTLQLQKILPAARTELIPLSSDQQRLWFIDQLTPGKALYNQYIALRLHGSLKVDALEKSIGEITCRHEILRTVFPSINGQAVQRIQPWQPLTIRRTDLRELPAALQESLAIELAGEEVRQPLSLEHGPLVKTSLFQLQQNTSLLLIIFHHIIIDAWSAGIFYRELAALYAAYGAGASSPLSEPVLQYADFVMWQRQWLQEPAVIDQLSYWKKQLADAPPILELPTDRPRPTAPTYRGAHYSFKLPVPLAESLKELSQDEGVTLFMTLLGAWQVLLHRYTNQDDILIGTPIANRNRSELEQSIGFFINTLVLRGNLSGNPSFRQFLQQVRQVTLDAYANQNVPFDWIVNELQLQRDLSYSPLFQVMFVLEKDSWSDAALTELELSPVEIESGRAIFDLTLSIVNNEQGLQGSLEYNTDLFDVTTIAALIDHWRVLLENIVVNPDQRLKDLPLLAAAERERILAATSVSRTASATDMCVQALFEAQVERAPEATAVLDEDREISYRELNQRANQLAHYLQSCGVGPEVRVGLCLERSLELLVGVVGILKAGGAYVPLDPTYPAERLAFMLADAQITVLLTQKKLAAIEPGQTCKVVYLDTDWESITQEPTHNPVHQVRADNLAYVIYTSGSTGRPKGVAMPHGPLTNLIEWQCHTSASSLSTRTLQFTTISFDVAFQEIFATWASGGTLVLIAEALRRDMPLLARFICDKNIERLFLPFAALQQLAEVFSAGEAIPSSLKEIITAGEQLQITQQVRKFFNRAADCVLYNHYGPSESHVVTAFALDKCPETWASLPPIGQPIDNLEMYVLDEQLQLVPTGVSGDLYIGGVGLARGYLKQPELTAERFIPHPFSQEPGMRLYRTGDLARYRIDGNLEFLGRYDTQVKLRGFRIELGEIEVVLTRHPAIRECIVLVREDDAGDKHLVAYVIMGDHDGEGRLSISELQQYLYERLPEYMVPSAFVMLDTFPLTPSGKVDRRALPRPDETSRVRTEIFVGPRTQTEEILASIWSEVLHLERISMHENFFVLGGHSLLATQLLARVCSIFQVELSLRVLFEAPTIAKLSEHVEMARATKQDLSMLPLVAVTERENLPLSFAQQRLWFLNQFEPLLAAYNVPTAIRLQGLLRLDVLEQCLQKIVQRHEALRTTFSNRDGHSVQLIAPSLSLELSLMNQESIPLHEQEAEVQRLAREEALQPFDLVHGPLMRVTLLRQHSGLHILLLTIHHIVCDGWSMGVFVRELSALYEAVCRDHAPMLEDLPCQYADFAVWQRECLQGDMLAAQQRYWQTQLSGAPALLELPTDRPRPATQTYRGLHQSFQLPLALLTRLKELSRREEVTLFMTLLAGFQALLSRYSGQKDILVGTPITKRNRVELEHLIGFFANTLVLRSDLSGNPDLHTLLQQVRKVCLDAYAHQDLPFEKVVEILQPTRALSHSPLFQVMFVLQNTPEVALELSDLVLSPVSIESGTAKFDLTLEITETAHGLDGRVEYNTDLFDSTTIQRLITHWRVLLEAWVADPNQRLGMLPLLTDNEQWQIVTDWNATRTDYAASRCLHELVEAQAERTPERVAVVFEDSFLTYGELNRRANQLAHYLQRLCIGPDVLVGICMDRSLEMVVGLLGILKAGGAYVPLDPSYPTERLSFMLADAQVNVLLTQRHLVENLPPHQAQVICLDDWEHIGQESLENAYSGTEGESLAYMIYTSGSTGRPKGAMNTHNAIYNRLQWMQEEYHLTAADSVLQKTPFSFDVSVWEFFWPLLTGARLVVALPERHGDSAYLAQLIAMQYITTMHFVPSMLREFLLEDRLESEISLRQVICSGEALSFELQKRFFERLDAELHNLYGPTEAAIDVTYWSCRRESEAPQPVPIGRPIANTQIYLLDEYLRPVPIGVAGELHIGGIGLSRGYFQRPELTAEKFIPDPFSQEPGRRLYKTGDLASYRPDGAIEYLGRIDHQVKIRGFRIELEEIEAVLVQYPAISDCVVLVREDQAGNKRLVAYIVPQKSEEEDSPLSWNFLRSYMQVKLPDYMLPSLFVVLEALPLTPNGKLNRAALPAPDWEAAAREGDIVEPRTEVEKILARVWEDVLGRQQVGIHDNFFALGGDSILSMQIIARASQQGVHFTPKQLFQYQTIAALSQVVETSPLLYAEQGPVRGSSPLTPIQHWFFDQQFAEQHHWNQSLLLEVQHHATPAMLAQAIQACLGHHDALRLRFTREENGWRQAYSEPDASVPFIQIDLSALTEEEQDTTIAAIDWSAQKSLDLTQGPLVQIVYLSCDDQERSKRNNLLLLVIHHLVIDGVSWQILLEDIERAYWQISQAKQLQLPRKTASFKQWAESLVAYAQTEDANQELAYWSEQLREAVAPLPVESTVLEEKPQGFTAWTISVVLTEAETRALLEDVSNTYHVRMNEVVLAALLLSFRSWTGNSSLLLDLEGHGREEIVENIDITRTVGWFTSLFPVLLNIGEAMTEVDALTLVQEQLSLLPNKGIGYGILRYLSEDEAVVETLQALPQAEVLFNYLGQFDKALTTSNLFVGFRQASGPLSSPEAHKSHLLEITSLIKEDQLHIDFTYSEAVHRSSTIERLATHSVEALRALIAQCQTSETDEGYSRAHFSDVDLTPEQFEQIFAEIDFS